MLKNKVLYTLVKLSVIVSLGGTQFQLAQAQRPAQTDRTAPDTPNAGPSFIQQLPNSAVSRIAEGGGWVYWSDYLPPVLPRIADQGPQGVNEGTGVWRRGVYGRLYSVPGPVPLVMSQPPAMMFADDVALYYTDGFGINRRLHNNVGTELPTVTLADGITSLVTDPDTNKLFWLTNTGKLMVSDRQGPVSDGFPLASNLPPTTRNLVIGGSRLYWFAGSTLYSLDKNCPIAPDCTPAVLVNENGASLLYHARISGAGRSQFLYWEDGQRIRAYSCNFLSGACSVSTIYDAWLNEGESILPGSLTATNGNLYWQQRLGLTALYKVRRQYYVFSSGAYVSMQSTILPDDPNNATYIPNASIRAAATSLYFGASSGGSNYFARIAYDTLPVQRSFETEAWEVTQGIQNFANDVPFVAGKPTFVRVYGHMTAGTSARAVDAKLEAWRNGVQVPIDGQNGYVFDADYSLAPLNDSRPFVDTAVADRAQLHDKSWLFQLPDHWTQAGAITLKTTINLRGKDTEIDGGANNELSKVFTFVRKSPVCLAFVPVRSERGVPTLFAPNHLFSIDMARRLLPTAEIWTYSRSEPVEEMEYRIGIPPWEYGPYEMRSADDNDASKILKSLAVLDTFTDDPDECDNANAITHFVGVVREDEGWGNGIGANGFLANEQLVYKLPASTPDGMTWTAGLAPTLAHELAHNYGRDHVDCPVGNPADIDGVYPYPTCDLDNNQRQAHWGFNTLSLFNGDDVTVPITPTGAGDLLSYAHRLNPAKPRWPSDYTWKALFNAIDAPPVAASQAALSGAEQALLAAPSIVFLSGEITASQNSGQLGHAWVLPQTSLSHGMQQKLLRQAAPAANRAQVDAFHVRVLGAGQAVLDDRAITLGPAHDETTIGQQPFVLSFPAPAQAVTTLRLMNGETTLAELQPGAQAPIVQLIAPIGGAVLDDQLTLVWHVTDGDLSDRLLNTLQYSPDDGVTWIALAADVANLAVGNTVSLPLTNFGGVPGNTTQARIRILVSDGYNTTIVTSPRFTVANRAPQPRIAAPLSDHAFTAADAVLLDGSAMDAEDGPVTEAQLRWSLDGTDLGAGSTLSLRPLAAGDHTLTLTATDQMSRSNSTSVHFTVAPVSPPLVSAPTLDGICTDAAYAAAPRVGVPSLEGGAPATAQLVRTADALWVCVSNLPPVNQSVGVLVDTDHSRPGQPNPQTLMLTMNEPGDMLQQRGDGTGYTSETAQGWDARAGVEDDDPNANWQAEFRIGTSVLGGWNDQIGLALMQSRSVPGGLQTTLYPSLAAFDAPNTWTTAVLGEVPHLSAILPVSATVGNAAFTLAVTGTGFETGAELLWNGVPRVSRVIDALHLEADIAAADLTSAGTISLTVRNSGTLGALSNRLAFDVVSPVPSITNATFALGELHLVGSQFLSGAIVVIDGRAFQPTILSTTSATVPIGVGADQPYGTVSVLVMNPGPNAGTSNVVVVTIDRNDPPQTRWFKLYLPLVLK
ncbi:MAG: hypothetical protein HY870_22095 [Chloroflexi bacterium]|nr:hypothetical protein [Chloroflexota bacterium]